MFPSACFPPACAQSEPQPGGYVVPVMRKRREPPGFSWVRGWGGGLGLQELRGGCGDGGKKRSRWLTTEGIRGPAPEWWRQPPEKAVSDAREAGRNGLVGDAHVVLAAGRPGGVQVVWDVPVAEVRVKGAHAKKKIMGMLLHMWRSSGGRNQQLHQYRHQRQHHHHDVVAITGVVTRFC